MWTTSQNDPKIRIIMCKKYTPNFGTSPYGYIEEVPPNPPPPPYTGSVMQGGILIYVREYITTRLLTLHDFPRDIEGLFVEINLRKTKRLLFGTYHPPSQNDKYFFHHLGSALDTCIPKYENCLLNGDFSIQRRENHVETLF